MPNPTERLQYQFQEQAMHGPFGGIQSDTPACDIERFGFYDIQNFILRKGQITTRPAYYSLPGFGASEQINGIYDFYRADGTKIQCLATQKSLYYLNQNNVTWSQVYPQIAFVNTNTNKLFNFAVVNYKLLFTNGVDPVNMWDGFLSYSSQPATQAYPAEAIFECDTHLVIANTLEAGVKYPQRVRWSGAGDPTDFTSFNSGIQDMTNDLGPIVGGKRLRQQGYLFHREGITQMIPTGLGLAPFSFQPFGAKGKGLRFKNTLDAYGDEGAAYVGAGNVYYFDGTQPQPIGSFPISDGSGRWLGARASIFAELASTPDPALVTGKILDNIAGYDYKSYWLIIPNGSLWIFNFDESNWTRIIYDQNPRLVGRFYNAAGLQVRQLVGTVQQQLWSPSTMGGSNPFDQALIAFNNGNDAYIDMSGTSETAWGITSGPMPFQDFRHNKVCNRFRIVYQDLGPVTFTVQFTNETGLVEYSDVAVGTGSGQVLSCVVNITKLSGAYLTWSISGGPNEAASFVEFTPYYELGGEFKNAN